MLEKFISQWREGAFDLRTIKGFLKHKKVFYNKGNLKPNIIYMEEEKLSKPMLSTLFGMSKEYKALHLWDTLDVKSKLQWASHPKPKYLILNHIL